MKCNVDVCTMLFRISLNKLIVLSLLFVACKKESTSNNASLEDGKSTVVYDLAGDTQASISDGVDGKEKRPFYVFLFNLKDKKQIWLRNAVDSSRWLQTNEWDLAFTGNFNADWYINNGNQTGNPGFGSSATNTAIVMLDQAYENVNEAPSDAVFNNSTVAKVGWADTGTSSGWYSYSLSTHLMKPYPNRTYALRLPDGKYAKLQLVNIYKGNPPAVTDMYWPAPYFTFRYYVQQGGSRNLNTK